MCISTTMSVLSRCLPIHLVYQPIQQGSNKDVAWILCHWMNVFEHSDLLLIPTCSRNTFQSCHYFKCQAETQAVKISSLVFLSDLEWQEWVLPGHPAWDHLAESNQPASSELFQPCCLHAGILCFQASRSGARKADLHNGVAVFPWKEVPAYRQWLEVSEIS